MSDHSDKTIFDGKATRQTWWAWIVAHKWIAIGVVIVVVAGLMWLGYGDSVDLPAAGGSGG